MKRRALKSVDIVDEAVSGRKLASATIANEEKSPSSGLALRLRHARLVTGLTMLQLAQKAGCSESLISKIERGSATPSLAMLHRLATSLDTNISALMSEETPSSGPILRRGERPVISANGIALERLVLPTRGGLLQANIHIVSAGVASDGLIEHSGEEIGYVLEGTIELTLGEERHILGEGDVFTFSSHIPHGYRNVGTAVARILWVNSPATF
jgi:transcriptional regulator with XRE-family HTH domain